MQLRTSLKIFFSDIKFTHSIFALPFAASALVIAGIGLPSSQQTLLLLLAMVSARSFAMGMNRYIDRHLDRQNPRTENRAIPSGKLNPRMGFAISLGWGALLVAAAFLLSNLAGYLSFPLLLVLAFYPYWKRFSWFTHWYLGMCLGFAPVAVCIALTGAAPAAIVALGIGVTMWTAGFDILYALQDLKTDKAQGIYSIPARFGAKRAIAISRACFVVMIGMLFLVGVYANLGKIYAVGVAGIALLLAYEHYLIRDAQVDGTSKNLGMAFFNTNAYVSVAYLIVTVTDAVIN
jgi:4-hydroxybenzoate polyprenyltransferase